MSLKSFVRKGLTTSVTQSTGKRVSLSKDELNVFK